MGGEAAILPKSKASEAVANAIEELGFGLYQFLPLLLTGGVFLAEGAEMLVMGSLTSLLHSHWELSPTYKGGMVSIVFVGFSVGNFLSGQIGDRFGRRISILIAYSMLFLFGFATAMSHGPVMMILLRFFVGAGCGIGFPAGYSLMPEVCPSSWKCALSTLMIGFMPLGEMVGALGVLAIDPELDSSAVGCSYEMYYPSKALLQPERCAWKSLCELSAIPAFLFLILAAKFLDESPMWLACHGRYEECEEVLQRMAKLNGKRLDVEKLRSGFRAAQGEMQGEAQAEQGYSLTAVCGKMSDPSLRYIVLFMFLAHIGKDFSVFGLSYMLPQYFVFLEGMSAGWELLTVASISMPGVFLTYLASRVQSVSLVHWLSGSAGLCSILALGMLSMSPDAAAAPCAYVVKLLALSYFVFTVVYTAIAFPTDIRNTAVGMCTCVGRIGSISAPLLFEISKGFTGSFDVFIGCLIAVLGTIAIAAPMALPRESEHQAEESLAKTAKDYGSVKSSA